MHCTCLYTGVHSSKMYSFPELRNIIRIKCVSHTHMHTHTHMTFELFGKWTWFTKHKMYSFQTWIFSLTLQFYPCGTKIKSVKAVSVWEKEDAGVEKEVEVFKVELRWQDYSANEGEVDTYISQRMCLFEMATIVSCGIDFANINSSLCTRVVCGVCGNGVVVNCSRYSRELCKQ